MKLLFKGDRNEIRAYEMHDGAVLLTWRYRGDVIQRVVHDEREAREVVGGTFPRAEIRGATQ